MQVCKSETKGGNAEIAKQRSQFPVENWRGEREGLRCISKLVSHVMEESVNT